MIPPAPFFFLKAALATQGHLCFHMNHEIFFLGFELCFHCHMFLEIFLIYLLISSVTCLLFRNLLFNLHVFVFLTVFFFFLLAIDISSNSIVVGEDVWYDLNFLKITEV